MKEIKANTFTTIPLGHRGEHLARVVSFDLSEWVKTYGDGRAELLHQRSGDNVPYPCALEQNGSTVLWTITNADTAKEGTGSAELHWYIGETQVKSGIYHTSVEKALDDSGKSNPPKPQQNWINQLLTEVNNRVTSGIPVALAQAKASGDFDGKDGKDGTNGKNGLPGEKGEKGDTGETGPAGATPVRGVDYWTETDLAEFREMIYDAYPTATISGSIASFDDGAENVPIKRLIVHIEPIQEGSGNPSPDNVRSITGWNGCKASVNGEEIDIAFTSNIGMVYCGKLDVMTGKMMVTHATTVVDGYKLQASSLSTVSDSSEFTYLQGKTCVILVRIPTVSSAYSSDKICSHFKYYTYAVRRSALPDTIYGNNSRGDVYWASDSFTTLNEYNNYLRQQTDAGTPVTLMYPLVTPITYQLTPQEICTLLGTNNIYSNCGPVEVTYRVDPTIAYQKLKSSETVSCTQSLSQMDVLTEVEERMAANGPAAMSPTAESTISNEENRL